MNMLSTPTKAGFTRTELFLAIAIIAALAVILVPTLGKSKTRTQGAGGLDNLRQLQLGWLLYSSDNDDKLVRSGGMDQIVTVPNDPTGQPGGSKSQWVLGTTDSLPAATNILLFQRGLLYPYINNYRAYKCPADPKILDARSTVRSVSMNCWMNPIRDWNTIKGYGQTSAFRVFKKQREITIPPPAKCWVLIDENPVSINDGWFVCDPNQQTTWGDIPASYHDGAGGLSFADGHSEIRRWRDRNLLNLKTLPAPRDAGSTDLLWLEERTTSLQKPH